jgi:hypothetical protein
MKIWNVTEADIRQCAEATGVAIFADWNGNGIRKDGRALNFRLALGSERVAEGTYRGANGRKRTFPLLWQRKGTSAAWSQEEPRRIASVCWHGHYAFMRYLLALVPEARIKTAFADYRGLDEFLRDAPETGEKNIGSSYYPLAMADACYCAEYGKANISELDRLADEFADAEEEHSRSYLDRKAMAEANFLLAGRANYDPQRGV